MEVGASLFSSTEQRALDSFLADLEDADPLDRPFIDPPPFARSDETRRTTFASSAGGSWGLEGPGGLQAGLGKAGGVAPEAMHLQPYNLNSEAGPSNMPSPYWFSSPSALPPPSPASAVHSSHWYPSGDLPGDLHPPAQPSSVKRRRKDGPSEGGGGLKGKGRETGRAGRLPIGASSAAVGKSLLSATSSLESSDSAWPLSTAPSALSPPSTYASTSRAAHRASVASVSGARAAPAKRPKKPSPTTASTPASLSASTPASVPPLLTAAQKKANHIRSEQTRRANIKRGHDALCEIVPALREGIAEHERREREDGAAGKGKGGKKKGRKGKDGEEKVDGRAGPKSEGTVLLKTIEYIRTLQERRLALLERTDALRAAARQAQPPERHSALGIGPLQHTPWEEDWDPEAESEGGSEADR